MLILDKVNLYYISHFIKHPLVFFIGRPIPVSNSVAGAANTFYRGDRSTLKSLENRRTVERRFFGLSLRNREFGDTIKSDKILYFCKI
ncbi:MAG: hypothetical protein A3J76_01865 [Candidatus Moranbacteria bacterium RBG_13_45_13]|nr:MAG: hypothetical protein A3J76_01865 [Candidatus Moranbacteria bacterium RBG_13_45_13]